MSDSGYIHLDCDPVNYGNVLAKSLQALGKDSAWLADTTGQDIATIRAILAGQRNHVPSSLYHAINRVNVRADNETPTAELEKREAAAKRETKKAKPGK